LFERGAEEGEWAKETEGKKEKGEGDPSLKTSPVSSSILRILGALSKSGSNEKFSVRDSLLECILFYKIENTNIFRASFPGFTTWCSSMQFAVLPTTTV
jgi:hypothetical protein